MDYSPPFFILANPRSGSSLFRIICDCNSQLSVPPESGFLVWWSSKYGTVTAEELADFNFLEVLVSDILSSKKIETWGLEKQVLLQYIVEHSPENYAEVASLVYYFQAGIRDKKPKRWGDKNNYYIHHLAELVTLYPKAKFIHLVRDGRDVACSYKNLKKIDSNSPYFPHLTDEIEAIAHEWSGNNRKIAAFLKGIDTENVLQVRYEDLLLDLKATSEVVCSFLEVNFDETMLRYYELNAKNAIEPAKTLDWKKKTLQQPDTSKIGQYKAQLTSEELKTFHAVAQTTLSTYHYE